MKISRENLIIIGIYILLFISLIQLLNGNYVKVHEYSKAYIFQMNEIPFLLQIQVAVYFFIILISMMSVIRYSRIINFIYIIFLLNIIGWSFYEIITGTSIFKYLLEGTSPFIYLSAMCIPRGSSEFLWKKLQENSPKMAIISIGVSIILAVVTISRYHIVTGRAPFLIIFTYAFWFISVTVFCTKTKAIIKWGLIIICILISILYGSRGWTLTSLFMLMIFNFENKVQHTKRMTQIFLIIAIVIFIYIFGDHFFPEQFKYFFGRIGESTRSEQYKIIFKMFDLKTILLGGGIEASYSFNGVQKYKYFDNVFIFNILHFGLLMASLYYLLILIPLFKIWKNSNFNKLEKGVFYVYILWFLSINGFSVYNGITYDAKNVFMMFILGRMLKIASKKYQNRERNIS